MHLFGLLTRAATLMEMDDIITSMTVLFSSPQSGENVEKHFQNLQNSIQTISFYEGSDHAENDLEVCFYFVQCKAVCFWLTSM